MILLDWTRMGRSYCLAGAVAEGNSYRIVRPLPIRYRPSPIRNVGWSPFLLEGHTRWEIFELVGLQKADSERPHVEDCWVGGLRSRRRLATAEQRRAVLVATAVLGDRSVFGVPLQATRSAAYVEPGTGERSLATLLVPAADVAFAGSSRWGHFEPDIRVRLPVPERGELWLPVKDHHLLLRTAGAENSLQKQVAALESTVRAMGERIAVRLGLSRGFDAKDDRGTGRCWLMADGFFSLADPQP
jgi:hypothetical protein